MDKTYKDIIILDCERGQHSPTITIYRMCKDLKLENNILYFKFKKYHSWRKYHIRLDKELRKIEIS